MNCFRHPSVVAVAQCANGCGRALCVLCAASHPPLCPSCAAALQRQHQSQLADLRAAIVQRIAVNAFFLAAYLALFAVAGRSPGILVLIFPIMLVWGFLRFRSVMAAFTEVTGLMIFTTLPNAARTYFIGSVFLSIFGILVIPAVIAIDLIRLFRPAP